MPTETHLNVPSWQRYAEALSKTTQEGKHGARLLQAHYGAPGRTCSAEQLAQALGHERYSTVNLHYGQLAARVGAELGYDPEPQRLGTLVTFEKRAGVWHWIMRPEVAWALEALGWVQPAPFKLPEEVELGGAALLTEGAVRQVTVNAYERSRQARDRCIAEYRPMCYVCGFDFERAYGPVAAGYIHVHHLRALSEIGRDYVVNTREDLRPVCPNCHAVLHLRNPAYSIEEVQGFLNRGAT